jgi:hypothetical protein
MPAGLVKSFAKKSGKSVSTVDRLWGKAKGIAAKAGRKGNYGYIVGILKKMLGISGKSEEVQISSDFPSLEEKKKPSRRPPPKMAHRGGGGGARRGGSYAGKILKGIFGITGSTEKDSPDYAMLLEIFGPEQTAKLLTETMPDDVQSMFLAKWAAFEEAVGASESSTMTDDLAVRLLHPPVHVLISWLSQGPVEARYKKFIGVI